jgi:hypothetical protein
VVPVVKVAGKWVLAEYLRRLAEVRREREARRARD